MDHIDFPDCLVDVVISNCVLNLCPDQEAIFRKAFRILKPGGRLAISDIIYAEKIDSQVHERFRTMWAGCVAGAVDEKDYFDTVRTIGFENLEVVARHPLPPQELEAMACCPGPAFTPVPPKVDLEVVQGKTISIKYTATRP